MIEIIRRGHRRHAKAAPLQKGADRNGLVRQLPDRAVGLAKAEARQRSRGALALNYPTLSLNCSLVDALERPSLLAESFKENWN
jgi:hypothetical protein